MPEEARREQEWLERHPLAHLVYDVDDLRILAANQAAVDRYGYSREELLAMTREQLLPPGEREVFARFRSALPAAAQGPQRVWHEVTKQGLPLRSHVRGVDIAWLGRRARLSAIMDAEPISALEEDARRQHALWQVAGAMAKVGGWSLTVPEMRLTWSDEICDIHERPRGHQPSIEEGISYYPGEAANAIRGAVQAGLREGRPWDLELPFVTAAGRQRWVRAGGQAVRDASGRIILLHGVLQDITAQHEAQAAAALRAQELQASEERLRSLLGAFPDLWMVFDADNRYCDVSDPADPRLARPWNEVRQRRVTEVLEPEAGTCATRALDAARATGRTQACDYEITMADGRRLAFDARCVPLSAGRVLLVTRDVTAQRQAEAAERARQVAEQAARHQREFLSRMSHELRTPLNAILGFGQLLQDSLAPGSEERRQLGYILGGGERMLELVDRLLQLQQLQRAAEPPATARLDDAVRRAAGGARALAGSRGVGIELSLHAARTVLTDRPRLDQLLSGLLAEVLRSSPAGSTVRIETAPGSRPLVIVRNTAVRPTDDPLAAAFQPLLRAKAGAPGVGLGLLIAQELAQQLEAQFDATCNAAHGLMVKIEFDG